jgi:transcription initiation factor IIE alpha subunit
LILIYYIVSIRTQNFKIVRLKMAKIQVFDERIDKRKIAILNRITFRLRNMEVPNFASPNCCARSESIKQRLVAPS